MATPTAVCTERQRNIPFARLSMEDGLSQSAVNVIFQDSKGFMWFGTNDGLNRYDGHDFTLYKHNPDDPYSLSHNRVQALFTPQRLRGRHVGARRGHVQHDVAACL